MGQLSETQIKTTKPGPTEFFLNDGDNLFLRVRETGKAWVYRYSWEKKPVKLGFGPYPAVSLAQARAKAREANTLRANGQDPQEVRRQQEEQARVAQLNSLERVARAWHASAKKDREWSEGYAEKVMRHLEIHVFPWVGDRPIETIPPTEIVRCLHRIKDRGNLETAQRVREAVQHVYQYAVDIGALEPAKNFVNKNTGGLPPPRSRHFAAITDPEKLGQLMRDIQEYKGAFITRCALRLAPMTFQRPGQIRFADWEDINPQLISSVAPHELKALASLPASQPPSLPASQPPSLPASQPPSLPASQPPSLPASQPCDVTPPGISKKREFVYTFRFH